METDVQDIAEIERARQATGGLYREFPLADRTAAARASLGEKAFDAAWAAGRALSLEDAVAFALADPCEG